ncbi:hypothetical protein [Halorussus sp. MSC15.2]|uniref:hypothetical protein n=1 Tax=Halorussus sp. MSC15.2 TaxID=2283638 RepID=UPI0013D4E639|nr:hypothetical protein [Halorussus sp. MSC15.2]NEU58023.1 hypothetical protein [Halorussus sp. MSC15.2]
MNLKDPRYTGENRCLPCTAVNLAISFALAAIAYHVLEVVIAAAILVLSVVLVYARGYLVPGTPGLTKKYLPETVLALFHGSEKWGSDETDADGRIGETEVFLHEHGIVEPCENGEDVCIAPDFRSSWYDRMASLRENDVRTVLGTHLDVAPSDVVVERGDERISVRYNGRHLGSWRSEALLLADVATELELRERHPEWSHLLVQEREQVIGGLRVFLDRCPDCLEPVTERETPTETCCSVRTEIAGECVGCGTQLYSLPQPTTA